MIVLDFRPYEEDLTLEKCVELYDEVTNNDYSKTTILTFPDQIWITSWQLGNIFSSLVGPWENFRDIPLQVKDI